MGTSVTASAASCRAPCAGSRTPCGALVAARLHALTGGTHFGEHLLGGLIVETRRARAGCRARAAPSTADAPRPPAPPLPPGSATRPRSSRRCRRSRRTCPSAGSGARSRFTSSLANGVIATTNSACASVRCASGSSVSSAGLDAAEQQIGAQRLGEHLARVESRPRQRLARPPHDAARRRRDRRRPHWRPRRSCRGLRRTSAPAPPQARAGPRTPDAVRRARRARPRVARPTSSARATARCASLTGAALHRGGEVRGHRLAGRLCHRAEQRRPDPSPSHRRRRAQILRHREQVWEAAPDSASPPARRAVRPCARGARGSAPRGADSSR